MLAKKLAAKPPQSPTKPPKSPITKKKLDTFSMLKKGTKFSFKGKGGKLSFKKFAKNIGVGALSAKKVARKKSSSKSPTEIKRPNSARLPEK